MGRPRKPLTGGHKHRRPKPTEEARIKAAVRVLSRPHKKKKASEPATPEQREETTLKGKRIVLLKKGHHQGRPKGSTNKVPTGIRGSIKAILERVVTQQGSTIEKAFVDGLRSGPRHADRYLKLGAEYVDGKPTDNVNLNARFNQDELGEARAMLGKKLDGILTILLKPTEGT
jgi:hypothetical protein